MAEVDGIMFDAEELVFGELVLPFRAAIRRKGLLFFILCHD